MSKRRLSDVATAGLSDRGVSARDEVQQGRPLVDDEDGRRAPAGMWLLCPGGQSAVPVGRRAVFYALLSAVEESGGVFRYTTETSQRPRLCFLRGPFPVTGPVSQHSDHAAGARPDADNDLPSHETPLFPTVAPSPASASVRSRPPMTLPSSPKADVIVIDDESMNSGDEPTESDSNDQSEGVRIYHEL
ncbi:hypothetical protein SEUCBS139899_009115 [Sporothrix eucalyptigena]